MPTTLYYALTPTLTVTFDVDLRHFISIVGELWSTYAHVKILLSSLSLAYCRKLQGKAAAGYETGNGPAVPKPEVPSADGGAAKRRKRTASNSFELERYDAEWRLIAKFTDRVFAVGRLCFPVTLNETSGPIYKISYDSLTIILR